MTATRRAMGLALAAAALAGGCSSTAAPAPSALVGAPSTAEYVALQASDVPPGLVRCGYSGPMAAYLDGVARLDSKAFDSVTATWVALWEAGGAEAYVAVYAETAGACDVWITGEEGSYVRGGSRVVSTVVVKFQDPVAAEAAYTADLFKQSALQSGPGRTVVTGSATGLGSNAVVATEEAANPAVHQAVWQNGPFNVFFNGRNLTRPEFSSASSLTNRRIQ